MRRPDLLAIQHELIAIALSLELEIREIGPGVRLRVPLTPTHLAARNARQMLRPLCVVAVLEQHRPKHREALPCDGTWHANRLHLRVDDLLLRVSEAAAAVLPRPTRSGPTLLDAEIPPPQEVGIGLLALRATPVALERTAATRPAERFRRVLMNPSADFRAKCL